MDVGGWLRSLGLEQYETAFQANAVNADVLRDLTDQDLKKLGVLLGHRPKLLRAIAALDSALGPASAPRDTPLPIPPQAILAAAAKRATHERQRRQDHSVSSSPQPFLMPNRLRSAEIDDRFLPSLEALRLSLAASDDRDDDNVQAAETGEVHGSPRWRHHLAIVIAVIAVLGLGAVGAFAYRAVLVGAVLPAPPSIVEAEGAPNENVPTDGDNQPSDLSQMSEGNAGSSKEFVSRFPADDQEPPEMAPTSPNPIASQSAPGSAVIPMVAAPSALPPSIAPPATSLPKVAAPVPAPSSLTPKKIKTAISRSDGSGKSDTSAATAKSHAAKLSAAASAPPAENQLAPDAVATSPEAKPSAAVPVGKPLSLTPDAHVHSAASPPSRPRMSAGAGTTAEISAGGGYVVAVASERSVADADAVFRSLQAKFPNQLGGREPIMRRTEFGPERTYYQASIGPFVSRKAAAGVCSSLKAAGESCLVEKN